MAEKKEGYVEISAEAAADLANILNGGGNRQNDMKKSGDRRDNQNGSRNYGNRNNGQNASRNSGNRNDRNGGDGALKKPSAPYNFVSFSSQVYEYKPEQLVSHAELSEELLTGEIEYEITAHTPIMVDKGKGTFYRNEYGRYALPGSTMRGLIRSNAQILGLASMNDDIDDYALMYRHVAKGRDRKHYNKDMLNDSTIPVDGKTVNVLLNVKAGYLSKENGKYMIYQTCKDFIKKEYKSMNYYVLSARTITKNYNNARAQKGIFDYSFFEEDGSRLQYPLWAEFKPIEKTNRKGEKMIQYVIPPYDKLPPKEAAAYKKADANYKPFFAEASYELSGDKTVTAVGKPGMYRNKGYVISTGKMQNKKAVYIIPEIDRNKKSLEIPEADVNAFRIDFNKRKNTLKSFGPLEFFDLPEKGIKPVFYIELGNRLYFGFTPRLRLFYDHTIKEGLPKNHKEGMLDYAKAMFGYSNKNDSYKSRVSFSDAVLAEDVEETGEASVVLAEPKPTSYSDYLAPKDGAAQTYNDADFQLRGVKQYWLREKLMQPTENANDKVKSVFCPLPAGSRFRGKVRFKNLTPEELGLLLWSMKLEENSHMNVGKGKAYGYGNISLELLAARKVNLQQAYKSGTSLCLSPWEPVAVEEQIAAYKEAINKSLAPGTEIDIDTLPHIKEFFLMKNAAQLPPENRIKYMKLSPDYTKRNDEVLPSIEDVLERK